MMTEPRWYELTSAPTANVTLAPTHRKTLTRIAGVVALSALTFAGAHVRIPLEPVPITLQTLFVLLAGALIGATRGALSQSLYLTGGLLGVPLFAGATGAAVLAGPTGGYLLGFVITPVVVGKWIHRRSGYAWACLVFSIGSLLILLLGVLHLTIFYTRDIRSAVQVGFLPFLAGDAVKTLAAASIYQSWTRLRSPRRVR